MKKLRIEWRHLDKEGSTCDRCCGTGENLRKTIEVVRKKCPEIRIEFREKKQPASQIEDSNSILFNGRQIEEIVRGSKRVKTPCPSCSELIGEETSCRAVSDGSVVHETIPRKMILAAVCEAAKCC